MEILILAAYFTIAAIMLYGIDKNWDEVMKNTNFMFPFQVYLARALIYVMVVFWPIMLIMAPMMKNKDK